MADEIPTPPSSPEPQPDLKSAPPPADAPSKDAAPALVKKKRRWPKILAAVLIFLLIVVIFAPSLVSTGIGKSLALKVVNGNLNGKAEVADWSLGWNSGVTVNGLKLVDEKGEVILQVSKIHTQLSLWKALKSGFDEIALGRTDIDNLDLTHINIDADGVPNIAKLLKPSNKKPSTEPLKLSGDIHVNNMTGKVTSAVLAQVLHIEPSNLSVKITGLNDPIENDIQLVFKVEDHSKAGPSILGSTSLVGHADLFDKDALRLDLASGKEKLTLSNVDVAAVNPFLALASLQLNVSGIANGEVDLNLQGEDNQAITGEITVANFVATGPALNDEKFSSKLSVPIKIRRITSAKGPGVLQVENLRVVTDYGEVVITADVAQDALQKLAKGAAPASRGHITVVVNFDKAARLISEMPKTLALLPDVKIESAHVYGQADVWIEPDRIVAKAQVSLADFSGTNKAGKIAIAPIASTIDATYVAGSSGHLSLAQFRDVALSLTSAFSTMQGSTGKDGTLAHFNLSGDADFAKLQSQLKQFSSFGELEIQGLMKFSLSTAGDPLKPDAAVDVTATGNISGLTLKGRGNSSASLKDQVVNADFGGLLNLSDDAIGADVKTLSLSAPSLIEIRKQDGELKLSLARKSAKVTGTGGVTIFTDFKRLADVAKSLSAALVPAPDAASGQLTKGILNGSINFTRGEKSSTAIAGDFVADVSISTQNAPIDDKISITLKASAPDDLTAPLLASIDVKGQFIKAAVNDAALMLARILPDQSRRFNGPLEILNKAKITANIDRLETIQPLLNSFAAPVAAAAKGPAPLPPIRNLAGKLAFTCGLSREGPVTSFNDVNLNLASLSFDRGEGHYESKDKQISVKLAGHINTIQSDGKSLLASIKSIDIAQLAADLDAGQLKITKPIVISNLAGAPTVAGAFEMEGKLADGLRLLEAFQAAKAGSKYPYTGYYVWAEDVSRQGEKIHLVGSLKASKFRAYDPLDLKRVTFAEDLITLNNDVTVNNSTDPAQDTATINNFDLAMQSTGALAIKISGGQLIDWTDQRKIADKLQAHLRIDWPKFWALVKPTLDPETAKSLEDLQLAGVMERDFSILGSFPATGLDKSGRSIPLITPQALQFLSAYGGLAFDRVATSGIEITRLDLPVSMEKGILYIQDATKPKGQRDPQPFSCNSGTIDLGGLQLDLTHADASDPNKLDPHLTLPANKQLVSKVTFNPVLAQTTLGKYVNPGFSNSKEASGLVSVTAVECRNVPFSWFKRSDTNTPAKAAEPIGDGRAEFVFSIDKVRVENAVLSLLVGGQVNGDIKKGTVVIEKGTVTSDIPITINEKSVLGFSGNVNLMTGIIKTFSATVPKSLFNGAAMSNLPPSVNKFIPENILVPFTGTLDKPKFDPVQSLIASATGGKGKPEDILKNLPDLLNGGKKDKR